MIMLLCETRWVLIADGISGTDDYFGFGSAHSHMLQRWVL